MSSAPLLTNQLQKEREYWMLRLSDGIGNSSLPPDFKRSKVFGRKTDHLALEIPGELARRLTMFAKNSPFLIYTTLMAAVKVCLWNYTGSSTIIVGSPGYRKSGSAGSGNALPILDHVDGNLSFREFLLAVRSGLSDAYQHQGYPLGRLIQDLDIEEDPEKCVLFDVALVLEGMHHELPDLKNGITFRFSAQPAAISGRVDFNARLFKRDTIERFAKQVLTILAAALQDVEVPLSRLPLMSDEERQQLWDACNNFNRDYAPDACLIRMFEAEAGRAPDALAAIFEDAALTYGALNTRANQLAHHLRRLGVGSESIVGLSVDRSLEMIVGILAILKAGAAYLPLDPGHPESRLAFMLADAQSSTVLTLERHRDKFRSSPQTVFCIDSDWNRASSESAGNPAPVNDPDSGAYVLFTSGSTGQPKGVMMPRRPLANLISWQQENAETGAGARTLQFASLSFDVSFQEIFATLCSGQCLVLITEDTRRDPAALWKLLSAERVERLFLPFIYLQQLAEAAGGDSSDVPLKEVITAGEQLQVTPSVVDLFRRMPGCILVNQYGPTEAHVVSAFTLRGAPTRWPTLPAIGTPIANSRIYLFDRHLRPVPVGLPGELYLGGVSIARCYLNRPELSAEKFVPHPYGSAEGERVYKTGDLARYLPDGNIEYLGRLDHQVKIRGFRVEIGEIEVALCAHSAVKECAVIAREDTPGDKRLAAYVVPAHGQAPSASDLRQFLKERLPEYMVPSAFVTLDALPLTRTGKVDRKALPAPNQALAEQEGDASPRSAVEETLTKIWSEVLGISRPGIHDNFFELGGDSILTIQVVARANRAGLRLIPKQLFQHQTIAALAAVAGVAQRVEAEQGAVSGPVPLTPIQHWFFEQPLPDPQHFNMGYLLEWRLAEAPVPELIRQTIGKLLEHHDALRLQFNKGSQGWQQLNAAAADPPPVLQMSVADQPEAEQARAIEARAAEIQGSLDIEAGSLIRVALFDLGKDRPHKLLLIIHHLAVDGVSWRILFEDFQTVYRQLAAGEAAELPAKTTSFKKWAERLHAHAQSEVIERELGYWASDDVPPFAPFPVDKPEGRNLEASAEVVAVTLDAGETTDLLRVVPKIQGLRINDVLLTALAETFSDWTGSRSLLVDLESHGREEFAEDLDVSRTVGWFTSIAPVRLDLRGAGGPADALESVKEQLRRIPNRGIGHGLLLHLSANPQAGELLKSAPRAQVSFNYLGQTDQLFGEGTMLRALGEPIGPLSAGTGAMPHLFYVAGIVHGGKLYIRFKFSGDSYERSTVESLARSFIERLSALIAHCRTTSLSAGTRVYPLAPLSEEQLAGALQQIRTAGGTGVTGSQVEDIYPLSPSQEGILFHSIYSPESGMYVIQMHCTFRDLNVKSAERAWQAILERYSMLRTAFVWDNVEKPFQLVLEGLTVPWQRHDWRDIAPEEVPERFDAYLEEDRNRGFDLNAPPLMRFSLIRIGESDYKFVWSHHHLLLDGWSIFIVLKEFLQLYQAYTTSEPPGLAPARPYSEYIAWLRGQNGDEAEPFWRKMLEGFAGPTPVGKQTSEANHAAGFAEHRSLLSAATTSALQSFAKQHQLTLNTVVQAAWAMLLGHYGGTKDIVFGATASGRPSELPGVESMVGIFINVLPMRIRLDESQRLDHWLKEIQREQFKTRQYEHCALVQIQRWSEVPRGRPLFESILSFENYPIDSGIREYAGNLDISEVYSISRTNYPITVVVAPRSEMVLRMAYDRGRFDRDAIEELAAQFATVLQAFAEESQSTVGDIQEILEAAQKSRRLDGTKKQEEARRGRFKLIKPKPVALPQELVALRPLGDSRTLPLVMEPSTDSVNLIDWAAHNRELIDAKLKEHGALLLRGFRVGSVENFQSVASAICPELFGEYGDLPREGVNGKVYRSTPYPSAEKILYHNESSHMHRWPLKIWFHCVEAARVGGETPIVDCREVYRLLDPSIRDRFERKRLMYVRNYVEGLDVSWQSFFGTEDRARVESYCRSAGIDCRWTGGNGLRTSRVCEAVAVHPHTGDRLFFNQVQLHHPSCLEPSVRETLAAMFSESDFPRNVYYGDGSPIENAIVSEIRALYDEVAVAFRWQENDILMLDNMLTAHARNPYEGPRKIVVAMGELINEAELPATQGIRR